MPNNFDCPTPDVLLAFYQGDVSNPLSETITSHLTNGCARCDTVLEQIEAQAVKSPDPLGRDLVLPPEYAAPAKTIPYSNADELGPHVGDNVDGYVIISQLRPGGMGIAYRVFHQKMNKHCVLKIANKSQATAKRFDAEIRTQAAIEHHANVLMARTVVHFQGMPALILDYVEGEDLEGIIRRRGQLPIAEACQYVSQAAEGLQHIHQAGVIHRDIKPDNLMRTPQGVIKIIDFGIALFQKDLSASKGREDITAGTPDYMSPEQWIGSYDITTRSDIFSLGCTLYHLLAGISPLTGIPDDKKQSACCFSGPPSLRKYRSDIPPELALVLDKMLATDAEKRYQTAAEVIAAIAPFAYLSAATKSESAITSSQPKQPTKTRVPKRSPRERKRENEPPPKKGAASKPNLPVIVGAVILVILVSSGAAWYVFHRNGSSADPAGAPSYKVPGPNPEGVFPMIPVHLNARDQSDLKLLLELLNKIRAAKLSGQIIIILQQPNIAGDIPDDDLQDVIKQFIEDKTCTVLGEVFANYQDTNWPEVTGKAEALLRNYPKMSGVLVSRLPPSFPKEATTFCAKLRSVRPNEKPYLVADIGSVNCDRAYLASTAFTYAIISENPNSALQSHPWPSWINDKDMQGRYGVFWYGIPSKELDQRWTQFINSGAGFGFLTTAGENRNNKQYLSFANIDWFLDKLRDYKAPAGKQ